MAIFPNTPITHYAFIIHTNKKFVHLSLTKWIMVCSVALLKWNVIIKISYQMTEIMFNWSHQKDMKPFFTLTINIFICIITSRFYHVFHSLNDNIPIQMPHQKDSYQSIFLTYVQSFFSLNWSNVILWPHQLNFIYLSAITSLYYQVFHSLKIIF